MHRKIKLRVTDILVVLFFFLVGCHKKSLSDAQSKSTYYTVSATVTGLSGTGLKISNALDILSISANGTYTFPTSVSGAYSVAVTQNPECKKQVCTVANGTGIASNNITNIVITCSDASPTFFALNWGNSLTNKSIFTTPDILNFSDGATATPSAITGSSTNLGSATSSMSLATDSTRNIIYAINKTSAQVVSFANAKSLSGNVSPTAFFTPPSATDITSVAIDPVKDILYVLGFDTSTKLWIYNDASKISAMGTSLVPNTTTSISSSSTMITSDPAHDRIYLYVSGGGTHVYDNASTITASSTPTRSIIWNSITSTFSIAINQCSNDLYITDRTTGKIYAFHNPETLTGTISLSDSFLQVSTYQPMNVIIDQADNLYTWSDSATDVKIIKNISTKLGAISTFDKTINGVADSSYGMGYIY